MSKQRLLFITTGGTIASVRTQQGLKPVLSSEELLAHLPELKELCCPETLALCSIDSTDLGNGYAGVLCGGALLSHPERR